MNRANVAVIGGGIVGLAFAWEAVRRGLSVVLFERDRVAQGASVRNFGMVWPIGQPPGEAYERALRGRERWLELGHATGLWVAECGSIHLAHEPDEDAVIREFAQAAGGFGIDCEYLCADEAASRFPAINPTGLRGALYSSAELALDPRQALALLPRYIEESHNVALRYGTTVTAVEMPEVRTAAGESWVVDRCFVCGGADFETLFPQVYTEAGIRRCKLQMMRTAPQPSGWRLGPHVAGGLTLTHYPSFKVCSTLPALKQRVAEEFAEYVRLGIHVMAAQNELGEVVIGDSHEYDSEISPFDRPEIDALILRYLRRLVLLPDWSIAGRWHGLYAKHPEQGLFLAEPQPECHIVSAPGGAGMTLSFGNAEAWWAEREP